MACCCGARNNTSIGYNPYSYAMAYNYAPYVMPLGSGSVGCCVIQAMANGYRYY